MSALQTLDKLQTRTKITGVLRTLTGLRVGTEKDAKGLDSDLPVLRDARLLPFIPGSSIKGVLRSTIEGLIRGAVDHEISWTVKESPPQLWSCNPLVAPTSDQRRDTNSACLGNDWNRQLRAAGHHSPGNQEELSWQAAYAHSCTVCRLFGNNEVAGRILIADLCLLNDDALPSPIEIRDGVAIDRDLLTAKHQAKYDFEVVSAGAEFQLELILENTTPLMGGLICAGISAISEGFARVGGFGSRGLGRVSIVDLVYETTNAVSILTGKAPENIPAKVFEQQGQAALVSALEAEHA